MTGEQFNKLTFAKKRLIKLLNEDEKHNGLQLVEGHNKDFTTFDASCTCCMGAIYGTTYEHRNLWKNTHHTHFRKVQVPNDSNVMVKIEGDYKFKATEIVLGPKQSL